MQELKCRARFPNKIIQNFGLATVGQFTLTLDSQRKIVRATAHLHNAAYKYLVIDDPRILGAFPDDRNCDQQLSFPPMTKFSLDLFDNLDPDDSNASLSDTARLVEVTNLPARAAFGRRPIESLEPAKGIVHAHLEVVWGKDVGHPVSNHTQAKIDARKMDVSVQHPVHSLTSPLPTLLANTPSPNAIEDNSVSDQTVSDVSHLRSDPIDDRSDRNLTSQPLESQQFESSTPTQLKRAGSSGSSSSDPTATSSASIPATSDTDHRRPNRVKCKICRVTPSHPWLPSSAQGREMAKVLHRINGQLPEDAQFEYGRMFNIERCHVAKKTTAVKNKFRDRLQDFAQRYAIVELHNEFATVQRKGEKRDYLLPFLQLQAKPSAAKRSSSEAAALTTRDGLIATSKDLKEVGVQKALSRSSQADHTIKTLHDSSDTTGSNSSDNETTTRAGSSPSRKRPAAKLGSDNTHAPKKRRNF